MFSCSMFGPCGTDRGTTVNLKILTAECLWLKQTIAFVLSSFSTMLRVLISLVTCTTCEWCAHAFRDSHHRDLDGFNFNDSGFVDEGSDGDLEDLLLAIQRNLMRDEVQQLHTAVKDLASTCQKMQDVQDVQWAKDLERDFLQEYHQSLAEDKPAQAEPPKQAKIRKEKFYQRTLQGLKTVKDGFDSMSKSTALVKSENHAKRGLGIAAMTTGGLSILGAVFPPAGVGFGLITSILQFAASWLDEPAGPDLKSVLGSAISDAFQAFEASELSRECAEAKTRLDTANTQLTAYKERPWSPKLTKRLAEEVKKGGIKNAGRVFLSGLSDHLQRKQACDIKHCPIVAHQMFKYVELAGLANAVYMKAMFVAGSVNEPKDYKDYDHFWKKRNETDKETLQLLMPEKMESEKTWNFRDAVYTLPGVLQAEEREAIVKLSQTLHLSFPLGNESNPREGAWYNLINGCSGYYIDNSNGRVVGKQIHTNSYLGRTAQLVKSTGWHHEHQWQFVKVKKQNQNGTFYTIKNRKTGCMLYTNGRGSYLHYVGCIDLHYVADELFSQWFVLYRGGYWLLVNRWDGGTLDNYNGNEGAWELNTKKTLPQNRCHQWILKEWTQG